MAGRRTLGNAAPAGTLRAPLRRAASWSGLPTPSPRTLTNAAVSVRVAAGPPRAGRSSARAEKKRLAVNTLVTFEEQGIAGPLFGSVAAVAADGTYTVELLDGTHRVGIRNAKQLAQDIWDGESLDVQDGGAPDAEIPQEEAPALPEESQEAPRSNRVSRQSSSEVMLRKPVSFFLEGSPTQMFGHVRAVNANGSFNVDLVGGGRLAGVEEVTACREEDVAKACKSKQRMSLSRPAYAEYATRNGSRTPSLSASQIDMSTMSAGARSALSASSASMAPMAAGQPVAFYLAGKPEQYFGRIRGVCPDGSYTVDLVGGGRKVGVEAAVKCTEEDLAREARAKSGMVTRGDPWSEYATANSHLSYGRPLSSRLHGGCPVSLPVSNDGKICGMLCGRVRSLAADGTYTVDLAGGGRRVSVRTLYPCTEEGLAREARSRLGSMKRDQGSSSMLSLLSTASTADAPSEVGDPVSLSEEGVLAPKYGRIRSVSAEGRYTVDLVGGGRKVGVEAVTVRTEEDLTREARGKGTFVTRPEAYGEYKTANTYRSPPPPGSPSSPRLRGVAIARVRTCRA